MQSIIWSCLVVLTGVCFISFIWAQGEQLLAKDKAPAYQGPAASRGLMMTAIGFAGMLLCVILLSSWFGAEAVGRGPQLFGLGSAAVTVAALGFAFAVLFDAGVISYLYTEPHAETESA